MGTSLIGSTKNRSPTELHDANERHNKSEKKVSPRYKGTHRREECQISKLILTSSVYFIVYMLDKFESIAIYEKEKRRNPKTLESPTCH